MTRIQRLRFRYRVLPAAAGMNQRQLVVAWQAAAEAAGLQIAYSESKRPSPQISPAAPLPLGVTSDWELIDVFLAAPAGPEAALAGVREHLPAGLEAVAVDEIGVGAPSLQSQLRWAEYEAEVPLAGLAPGAVRAAIERLLEADTLPAEYRREAKVRQYDLRRLVLGLWLAHEGPDRVLLTMRLRAEPEMSARADQVLLALGLPPARRIHRRRLHVAEGQAAVQGFRQQGEPPVD